jgi:uncharacterized protein (TIGR03435 family)
VPLVGIDMHAFRSGRLGILLAQSALITFTIVPATSPAQTDSPLQIHRFDVASVRRNVAGTQGSLIQTRPDGITATNVTIPECIQFAWQVRAYQVDSGNIPSAGTDHRYDIFAKSDHPIPLNEVRMMLKSLLAERLALSVHSEKRQLAVFALVIPKDRPLQLHDPKPGEPTHMSLDPDSKEAGQHWLFHNSPLSSLAGFISSGLDRPLIDSTGLDGKYDYSLIIPAWDKSFESLEEFRLYRVFPAVERQLGLRIATQKAPFDVVVIDKVADSPSEN